MNAERENPAAEAAKQAVGTTGPELRPDLAERDDVAPAGDEHLSDGADSPEGAQRGRLREPEATGTRPGSGGTPGANTGQEAASVSEPG